jgi:hypothetical protein
MGKKKAAPYEKGLRPIIFLTKLMSEGGLSDAVTVHQSCVDTKTLNTLFQNTFYSFHNVILSIFFMFYSTKLRLSPHPANIKEAFFTFVGQYLDVCQRASQVYCPK